MKEYSLLLSTFIVLNLFLSCLNGADAPKPPPDENLRDLHTFVKPGTNPPGGMGTVVIGMAKLIIEVDKALPKRFIEPTPSLTGIGSHVLWKGPSPSGESCPHNTSWKKIWTWEVAVSHPNGIVAAVYKGKMPLCNESKGDGGSKDDPAFDGVVVNVDLDFDSDRNSTTDQRPPDRKDAEEIVETTAPGAIVALNEGYDEKGDKPKDPKKDPKLEDWEKDGIVLKDPDLLSGIIEVRNSPGTATFTYPEFIKLYDDKGSLIPSGKGKDYQIGVHKLLVEGIKSGVVDLKVSFLPTGGTATSEDQVRITVVEIVLEQNNYPTDKNTTDIGKHQLEVIKKDGTAYIVGDPEMPTLVAKITPQDQLETLQARWLLEITSERSERQKRDDMVFPVNGKPLEQKASLSWDIHKEFAGKFVGGNCVITCDLVGIFTGKKKPFKIRGKNPLDKSAKDYVVAQSAFFSNYWAMVQHESRVGSRVYNQFNPSGKLAELPNYGAPDGWGIAQVEMANTQAVYNWKGNVNAGIVVLKDKMAATERFFDAVKRTYPGDADAASPPASFTVPGTSTALSAKVLSSMVLYNGAGGTQTSPLTGPNGKTINYQNPWKFDPKATPKWSFKDNSEGYSKKVIAEIEGLKYEE